MNRPASILRRVLAALLTVTPLLAGADLCTLGAIAGRADLACAMESGANACRVTAAPAPGCAHCTPATPAKTPPRHHGPTCCDLRPEADGAVAQLALSAPAPTQPLAVIPCFAVAARMSASVTVVTPDDGRAPPGALPPLLSPRAPPQA
jgi:hypothetical protein